MKNPTFADRYPIAFIVLPIIFGLPLFAFGFCMTRSNLWIEDLWEYQVDRGLDMIPREEKTELREILRKGVLRYQKKGHTKALKDYLSITIQWNEKQDNSHLDDEVIFGQKHIGKPKTNENPKQPAHLTAEGSLIRQLQYYIKKIPDLDKKNPNGFRVIHRWALLRKR